MKNIMMDMAFTIETDKNFEELTPSRDRSSHSGSGEFSRGMLGAGGDRLL